MVVRHLRVVKHFLRFGQFRGFACFLLLLSHQLAQAAYLRESALYALEDSRHFRVNIIAQKRCVHAGIGGHMFLVQTLYQVQRLVRRITVTLVAFHLQTGQIKQARRIFRPFLFLYLCHRKR